MRTPRASLCGKSASRPPPRQRTAIASVQSAEVRPKIATRSPGSMPNAISPRAISLDDRPELRVGDAGLPLVSAETPARHRRGVRRHPAPSLRVFSDLAPPRALIRPVAKSWSGSSLLLVVRLMRGTVVDGDCGAAGRADASPAGAPGVGPAVGHQPKRPSTAWAAGSRTGRTISTSSRIATATPIPERRNVQECGRRERNQRRDHHQARSGGGAAVWRRPARTAFGPAHPARTPRA